MTSLRLQILEALATRLDAPSVTVGGVTYDKPAGLTVSRDTLRKVDEMEDLPIAFVYIDEETGERVGGRRGPITERLFDVIVEVVAVVPREIDEYENRYVNTPVEDVTDPYLNWAVRSVMADERLGGLCHSIQEAGTVWDHDFLEEAIAGAGIRFTVTYHTRADDLTRR